MTEVVMKIWRDGDVIGTDFSRRVNLTEFDRIFIRHLSKRLLEYVEERVVDRREDETETHPPIRHP